MMTARPCATGSIASTVDRLLTGRLPEPHSRLIAIGELEACSLEIYCASLAAIRPDLVDVIAENADLALATAGEESTNV